MVPNRNLTPPLMTGTKDKKRAKHMALIPSLAVILTSITPISGPAYAQATTPSRNGGVLTEVGPWGAAATSAFFPPLPATLWANSDASSTAILLDQQSGDQRIPLMQNLLRRVILSGGDGPGSDVGLVNARLNAALRLGPVAEVANLWASLPRLITHSDWVQLAIDSHFLAGQADKACQFMVDLPVDEAPQGAGLGRKLLEQRALCYDLNGSGAAAELTADLARAEPDVPAGSFDAAFMEAGLLALLSPDGPPLPRFNPAQPHYLAMSLILKAPVTAANINAITSPAIISALANAPVGASATSGVNIAATERAAIMGLMDPAIWNQRVPLAPEPVPVPLVAPIVAPIVGPALTDTGLMPVAVTSAAPSPAPPAPPPPPPFEGKEAARLLQNARTVAERAAISRRVIGRLAEISHIDPADANLFAEAALWASNIDLAKKYLAEAGVSNPRLPLALTLLAANGANDNNSNFAIAHVLEAAPTPAEKRRVTRLAAASWAAGFDPRTGRNQLILYGLDSATIAQPGLLIALSEASQRRAMADVVLISSLITQGKEMDQLDGFTLSAIIRAFMAVGLVNEARQLAGQAVLADLFVPPAPPTPARAPAPRPVARPAAARPAATGPAATPAPRPATRPATRPTTRPATRPANGGRN